MLLGFVPDEAEVAGLLALLLLTEARRAARTDAGGAIVPLAASIEASGPPGRSRRASGCSPAPPSAPGLIGLHQLEAGIAAVHDEASSAEETDWRELLALYEVLEEVSPGGA